MIFSESKLSLGTAQFGSQYEVANSKGPIDDSEAEKILIYASKVGINTLDTAIVYGNAEKRLGNFGVSGFKIVSKIPAIDNEFLNQEYWLIKQVQ